MGKDRAGNRGWLDGGRANRGYAGRGNRGHVDGVNRANTAAGNRVHMENSSVGKDCAWHTADNRGASNNSGVSAGIRLRCSIIAAHNRGGFYSRDVAGSSVVCSRCAG